MRASFVLAALDDMDLVVVVQTLITKCMENESLCNEFYLQLIKQTTDTKTGQLLRCVLFSCFYQIDIAPSLVIALCTCLIVCLLCTGNHFI